MYKNALLSYRQKTNNTYLKEPLHDTFLKKRTNLNNVLNPSEQNITEYFDNKDSIF